MRKLGLILVLALLVAGGALVTLGEMDKKADLSSVMEMWGDALRDADQTTLRVTRVSDAGEMRFGQEMRSRLSYTDDPTYTPYVAAVGATLVPHLRRQGMRYEFHVVASPQINAFAIPGGHIYVLTGMLGFLKSEAELATVLGHEMSHVDLRHCIERYQYELAARKIGLDGVGQLADLARLPIAIGYAKYQEIEADEQGARLSIQAGYDPTVAPVLFSRMQKELGEPGSTRAATPQGEVVATLAGLLTDYFRSHPTSEDRSRRLGGLVAANRGQLRGKALYVGVTNYQKLVPRTAQEFPGEKRSF